MRTALVTGGARGIGRAIVSRLCREGWRVAFTYQSRDDAAQSLHHETGALPIKNPALDEAQAGALYDETLKQLGHVGALVLNAGVSYTGLLSEMSVADWDALIALNLRGAFLVSRAFIPHLVSRKAGSLLFISSIWGIWGASCEAAYATSKAGLIGLAKSLALELGPCGIRVNALAPGVIRTDMLNEYSPDDLHALAARTPLGRLGEPCEVAAAAHFLLSDKASYITGQVLGVDGGFI
ncbi:MAG: 3-oxoacyl-ACP reductase FabG [Eubacteriales bacterium]|nr:3-oxoacyl-ACP reductase FabG [Eubacteriales bacterium]